MPAASLISEAIAISLIWIGMCISDWTCGSMFNGCNEAPYNASRYLLLVGTIVLSVVLLMNIFSICMNTGGLVSMVRTVCQCIGAILTLAGLIIYFIKAPGIAGFLVTMGASMFIFITILGLLEGVFGFSGGFSSI